MRKQQIILVSSALILLLILFFFGKTTSPPSSTPVNTAVNDSNSLKLNTEQIFQQAKSKLNSRQLEQVAQLEKGINSTASEQQKIENFKKLSHYYGDSLHEHIISTYYLGQAALLENSEKNLTFAARSFLDELLMGEDASLQTWFAIQAKELFQKALVLQPENDSAKVGIAVCYIFGNIGESPMQGIQMLRGIADENPQNLYAQMMLGIASLRSGQYDKAVERFITVVQQQPQNIEAVFSLAEAYDRKGDKANAIKWYKVAGQLINVPEAKSEIEKRIQELQ